MFARGDLRHDDDMTEPSTNPDAADEQVTEASAGPIDDDAMADAEGLTVTPAQEAAYVDSVEKGAHAEGEGRFA